MYTVLIIIHIIVSVLLMAAILVQSGKGGGLAAGLGGASATQDVFGSVGAQSFLKKSSVALGAVFMGLSLVLALMSSQTDSAMDLSSGETRSSSQAEPIVSEGGGAEESDNDTDEATNEGSSNQTGSSDSPASDTQKPASGSTPSQNK